MNFGGSEGGLMLVTWKKVKKIREPGLSAEEEMIQNEVG